MAVLAGSLLGQPAVSQEENPEPAPVGAGTLDEGPDGDPFSEAIETRRRMESGEPVDSVLSSRFEPLHKLWDPFAEDLRADGVDVSFQYTVMVQHSDDLVPGIKNKIPGASKTLSGGDADLYIKWHAYEPEEPWAGYFRVSVENRHGYSELPPVGMGPQTGSVWLTMRGWTEYDGVAITEAYWHQGTLKSPFEYRIGRVKNTTIWNGGKYISGNTGMVGGQITGTPAMVTFFSGWSMTGVYHPIGGNTHIAVGIVQGNGDNETVQPLHSDELTYALQVGWKPEFMGSKGRYHVFAWHVDETDDTSEANGFALNAEHQFGNWTPFFRYSYGDQDRSDPKSVAIRQSANLGIGYDGLVGGGTDWLAVVATWAEPTNETLREQYGVEVDYSFRFTPNVTLTPHIQLIHDPSNNPDKNNLTIVGLRTRFDF